jgi:hypothetical protein
LSKHAQEPFLSKHAQEPLLSKHAQGAALSKHAQSPFGHAWLLERCCFLSICARLLKKQLLEQACSSSCFF